MMGSEIEQVLGEEKLKKLEFEMIQQTLKDDVVQCKCGNVISLEDGEIYYDFKGGDNQELSSRAAEHMSCFRVRCPSCSQNFCHGCQASPYHLGLTC
jgi:hypothetical protein